MLESSARDVPVAIVGIGCRFPGGADSPDKYWRLLSEGVDAVGEFPPDRFDVAELFDPDPDAPGKTYSKWGGFLERVDGFDADFFGISPREARRMDPQQRLLLEVVWEALENGGHPLERLAGGNAGVFVGISTHDYLDRQELGRHRHRANAYVNTGGAASIAANRISYLLDAHGPSFSVDTACSSSLTAVHLACRSLAADECDLAIASGVGILLAPEVTVAFCKASMLSPRGRCHAFDAGADGFVRGEGGGAVVLKRLDRALADGDRVHAVIRGSAINQDGHTNGLTVPSASAQRAMIQRALHGAGVAPHEIQYVEAHGTGTPVGDPIEAEALGSALADGREPDAPCVVGSAKTNLGHLEAAAGIAGLIKASLALQHRQIPPSLHFVEPNPAIPFDALRLRVPKQLEPWPSTTGPARAGVNSFGFGGANAHVVLEEAPAAEDELARGGRSRAERDAGARAVHVLTLSARSAAALRELADRHRTLLRTEPGPRLHDHAFTTTVRRTHHPERLAVVAGTRQEAAERLDAFLDGGESSGVAVGTAPRTGAPKLAFVFPGMGAQWSGMARDLLRDATVVRRTLEEVDDILRPLAGWSLLELLERDQEDSRVAEADVAHVANLGVQLGLAALWRTWGVVPDAVVGHSSGEMAAACVAGALTLPDAVTLAYHRGRLQHRATGTGTMLAAAIPQDYALRLIRGEDEVSLAAINAPNSVTLSGTAEALERIAANLSDDGHFVRLLSVRVPYHGPQMEAIREEFLHVARGLEPRPCEIPLVSEVEGDWIDGASLDASYWWRNVRQPVQFAAATERLIDDGCEVFVEVGPHPVLSGALAETIADRGASAWVLPSLRRNETDERVLLGTLSELHVHGHEIAWSALYPSGECVGLPGYPWQRERYWFEADDEDPAGQRRSDGVATGHPLLGRRLPAPHPTWQASLDDTASRYLTEHVVQGAPVFPGAGYVEMALATGRELWGEAPVRLEDVRFQQLLFLAPTKPLLQLQMQPSDGSIEIHASPGGYHDRWNLHATGRLSRDDTTGIESLDLAALQATYQESLAVDEHYASFERRGFSYGHSFRTLEEIRLGPDGALASVAFRDGAELSVDAHTLHPALLDGVLQLVGAVTGRSQSGEEGEAAYLPVSIRRVVLRNSPGKRFWAHVRVRGVEGGRMHEMEGDAWLADEHGHVMVYLEGLQMRALHPSDTAEATGSTAAGVDEWLYRLRWEEAPHEALASGAARALHDAPHVATTLEKSGAPPEEHPDLRHYLDVAEPRLERVAEGFTLSALERLGWGSDRLQEPTDRVAEELAVAPRHRRLFAALIEMMRARASGGRDALASVSRDHDALNHALDEVIAEDPRHSEAELLRLGGTHLAEILKGTTDAREVMLTDEARELLRHFYTTSPPIGRYHQLLADAVDAAVDNTDGSMPLRVLELGAGTGAATEAVLPRLPAGSTVTFTDVSPFFLEQARARFGQRPGMRFETLDIEVDPTEQGFEAHSFDLVFAANVLHVTQDLRTTLRHVRSLLADGGLLAVMELTRRSRWLNLVFGLLDGWWRYRDEDLRSGGPMLEAAQWTALLEECGFMGSTSLFADAPDDRRVQTVQLARAPAPGSRPATIPGEAARRWLVFSDGVGVADRVIEALRGRGDVCTVVRRGDRFLRRSRNEVEVPPDDERAYEQLVEEIGGCDSLHGIVHLWSLDMPAEGELDAASLLAEQRLGCGSVRALAVAVHALGGSLPEIWLVTAGAQAIEGIDAAPHVAQSALWGLARSLMSEHEAARCRLVDLGPEPVADEAEALAQELMAGVDEDELALRGHRRYVRRLRRTSLADHVGSPVARRRSPDEAAFRLEIARPGAIESASLRDAPFGEPGPGEVAVRVRASGLNFRDVLQALDMIPPSVYSYDRDPGGIGSECAGVVVACAEGVTRFRPGDEVMAMASAAHGSRAITHEDLCISKPAQLSFAEAASILGGFVTAEYSLNDVARIAPGERVLIHSATGGVGLSALQVCRLAGADVFATAGTPEKRDLLRSLGVEHVMDSRSLAFADEVLRVTGGEGVDVVMNTLSGEATRRGLAILRPYGRFIELGKRDIAEDAQVGLGPFERNRSYHAVDLLSMTADRPDMVRRLIERVVQRVADGDLEVIPITPFDLSEAEAAFRLMAQAKHVGKVVLTVDQPGYRVHARDDGSPIDPQGTYLITGGLGGFGLAVAGWLAREGAGSIVLMGRSRVPKDGPEALEALMRGSARVSVVQGDVTDEGDVHRVLDQIRREHPPLKGVFHAAMVLDDDHLGRLDHDRFERALAPKAAGAWNLHRLTLHDELDHFVLFSSVAGVMGVPMQANYAAGNTFLDSLAVYRRAQGLPGTAIAWGALADVGFVSRHDAIAHHLERGGFHRFTAEQALEVLEQLVRHDVDHVMAAAMDWRTWAEINPLWAASHRFQHLVRDAEASDGQEEALVSVASRLRSVEPGERHDVVQAHLTRKVSRILGTVQEKVDPGRPFTELGFDSLMAVELVTAIRADLDVKVPVVAILQSMSTSDLAERVLGDLGLEDDQSVPTPVEGEAEAPEPGLETMSSPDPQPMPEHPLSYEQQRFWFLDRLGSGTPAYHLSAGVRLKGRLDRGALERSLTTVLERHETLRAAVREVAGVPVQRYLPPRPVTLPVVDLSDREPGEREDELQRRATEEIQRPFDLASGPLLRTKLFRVAEQEHVVLLVVHHLASDAWSMNLLAGEIVVLYGAFLRGEPSPLDPPSTRYLEHIDRQRRADEGTMEAQLAYWTRQLAGAPTQLQLPVARSLRTETAAEREAHLPFALSTEATMALRRYAQRQGATLFMVLLAAFKALLHRYTGASDICVGTAVSTRTEPGAETVVGCYLNTLVLRSDLGGDPSFRELLARVRRTTLDAFAHQDVPFDQVIEALAPERPRDGQPLVRAMLVLHNARPPELDLPGLQVERVPVESGASVTDLALILDDGDGLGGTIEYDAGRFERATIEAIRSQFRVLLEAIPAHADRPLFALPLQSDAEREYVLAASRGPRSQAVSVCLHELVETQAERTPDAVAVEAENERLSYAELERRGNRLAHRLRALGVGPDVPVGVYMPRSAETVVAALGVLKAGGAYLPLDASHPLERTRSLLADADAPVVITGGGTAHADLQVDGREINVLELREAAAEGEPSAPIDATADGLTHDHLAYVMYTSGSTGVPKGVMVSHRAIVNQVRWRQECSPLSAEDAVLHRTPLGFDPSVWELFGPLSAGARVVVPPGRTERDGAALVKYLAEREVTVLQATPSLLDVLLEESGLDRCDRLQRVFCGGEPLPTAVVRRFFARLEAELHHLYGPTETAIDATHRRCCSEDGDRDFVPLGRPIANTRVYVLDAHGEPVPVGVPGELHIGGPGLARGYLGRPELTEDRFVADPFSDVPGARLYRTGDWARRWPDGRLEFLGREDRQLKLRGMRLEPAEIEAALRTHHAVREAAVVAAEDAAGNASLAAFVVTDHMVDAHALREYVADRLPAHMVPIVFHELDGLPRTDNDKVDRAALAKRAADAPAPTHTRVAPRNDVEVRLLRVWKSFFPDRDVGVTDDFFDLGGHSLMAMRLLARIEDEFGRALPVASVFEGRTIERQAALLREPAAGRSSLIPIQTRGEGRPLYCIHPVSGSSVSYAELASALGEDRPVYGLDAIGLLERPPHERITEMARHYLEEVTRVQPEGPYLLAGWSMGAAVALEMARRLEANGGSTTWLVVLDGWVPVAQEDEGHDEHVALVGALARELGLSPRELADALGEDGHVDPKQHVERVFERLRALKLVPPDLGADDPERRQRVFAAHLRAMRSYQPRPFSGRLTLIEPEEPIDGVTRRSHRWQDLANGGITRHSVPGNHYTMLRRPNVVELAEWLRTHLASADQVDS